MTKHLEKSQPDGLLLLHGFMGSERSWDIVREHLDASVSPVLIPTLFGHGTSLTNETVLNFEDEVNRIALFVEKQGLKRVHVCGYSMGARVAFGLLVLHSELIHSATLVAPHPGLKDHKSREDRGKIEKMWIDKLRTDSLEEFVAYWENLPIFGGQEERVSKLAWEAQRQIRLSHHTNALIQAIQVLGTSNMPYFQPKLGNIQQEVTIVVGEGDSKFLQLSNEVEREVPNCSRLVFSGGHNVVLEHPQKIAKILKKIFLVP